MIGELLVDAHDVCPPEGRSLRFPCSWKEHPGTSRLWWCLPLETRSEAVQVPFLCVPISSPLIFIYFDFLELNSASSKYYLQLFSFVHDTATLSVSLTQNTAVSIHIEWLLLHPLTLRNGTTFPHHHHLPLSLSELSSQKRSSTQRISESTRRSHSSHLAPASATPSVTVLPLSGRPAAAPPSGMATQSLRTPLMWRPSKPNAIQTSSKLDRCGCFPGPANVGLGLGWMAIPPKGGCKPMGLISSKPQRVFQRGLS